MTIGLTGEALEQTYCAQRHRVTRPSILIDRIEAPSISSCTFFGRNRTQIPVYYFTPLALNRRYWW